MGHIFLINESFETNCIPQNSRDKVINNFCDAIDCIKSYPDKLYGSPDLHTQNFSYGNIYTLLYGSWPEVKQLSTLRGLTQTTHSFFKEIMFDKPSLFNTIESREAFDTQFAKVHYGYSGFDFSSHPLPYIKCEDSWQEWKCNWLSQHQNEIDWNKTNDAFLPNKAFIIEILKQEIFSHKKESEISNYNGSIVAAFYEVIMKSKGTQTEAYSREIGSKIARANYYNLDLNLTKAERKASGNSLRAMFALKNKYGKQQYIAIDHRHGTFEYYNHHGVHLGEYRFDGTKHKQANTSHNLKSIK